MTLLIAFTRNNNNTGRKTLHGHWLLWIKNLSKLREMLFHHNKEAQEAARKEFIAYIDSVMSASYTDNALRVEYECNAGNNDTTNVVVEEEDGNSNKKSVVEDHFYDFKDDSPNKLEDSVELATPVEEPVVTQSPEATIIEDVIAPTTADADGDGDHNHDGDHCGHYHCQPTHSRSQPLPTRRPPPLCTTATLVADAPGVALARHQPPHHSQSSAAAI